MENSIIVKLELEIEELAIIVDFLERKKKHKDLHKKLEKIFYDNLPKIDVELLKKHSVFTPKALEHERTKLALEIGRRSSLEGLERTQPETQG